MNITVIQHTPFENPGCFLEVFQNYGPKITFLNAWEKMSFSYNAAELDLLLIMGGPMNIYEEDIYPWLKNEKEMIRKVIESGKMVIGVCLGAQMIADILGAKVYKNKAREIGWYPLQKIHTGILDFLPDFATVFHWHGETFDIPEKAIPFYRSELTANQSFLYENRILALQFHLEMNQEGGHLLCTNCRDELDGSRFVMSEEEILKGFSLYASSNRKILKNMVSWLLYKNGFIH